MKKDRIFWALCINALLVVLEIVGTTISIAGNGLWDRLQYFTVDSNILTLIGSALLVASILRFYRRGGGAYKMPGHVRMLRYLSACTLALTFLVVFLLFVPLLIPTGNAGDILWKGAEPYHHVLCPILSVASFCFVEDGAPLRKKDVWAGVAPSIVYAVVLTILNLARIVRGPYPFLYVYEQPVLASVAWFFAIPGFSYLVCRLLRRVRNGRLSRRGAAAPEG